MDKTNGYFNTNVIHLNKDYVNQNFMNKATFSSDSRNLQKSILGCLERLPEELFISIFIKEW